VPIVERLAVDDAAVADILIRGDAVGVRSSGWTYLSTTRVRRTRGGVAVGELGPPAYRHLTVDETGAVTFTTDRDRLWSWHAAETDERVIDPFVLTEYPASVLRLTKWLLARTSPRPSRVLVELLVRNCRGAVLVRGRPGSAVFGFGGGSPLVGDAAEPDPDHLVVPSTAPLDVSIDEFLADSDRTAFTLARKAYRGFGLSEDDIPFYDRATQRFVFPR
jgi:hypothetical protein